MTSLITLVQTNLKKCKNYTSQLLDYADRNKINILAIQEPYHKDHNRKFKSADSYLIEITILIIIITLINQSQFDSIDSIDLSRF